MTGAEHQRRYREKHGEAINKRRRESYAEKARGGSNDISNIVPACRSCNSRKGARTIDEFLGGLA